MLAKGFQSPFDLIRAFVLPRKRVFSPLTHEKGQTTVEYLLLLAMAFAITWLVTNNLLESFIGDQLKQVSDGMKNTVRNAEWRPTEVLPGSQDHPGNPARHKAMHF